MNYNLYSQQDVNFNKKYRIVEKTKDGYFVSSDSNYQPIRKFFFSFEEMLKIYNTCKSSSSLSVYIDNSLKRHQVKFKHRIGKRTVRNIRRIPCPYRLRDAILDFTEDMRALGL